MFNVGIWGTSKHSVEKLLPCLLKQNNLNFIGFLSRSQKEIKYNNLKFPVFTDEDDFCGMNEIDLIIIATPPALHFENAIKALSKNKNVIVEKPITIDLKDTKLLCNIAKEKELLLVEGFYYKYNPHYKIIKNNIIELDKKNTTINIKFGIPFLNRDSFRNKANLGASSFWDIGCYPLSLICDIFDENKLKIKSFDLSYENAIDKRGNCLIEASNRNVSFLEWGIGFSYQNMIEVWSEEIYFKTNYIFSKPDNASIIIEFSDRHGKQTKKNIQNINSIDLFFQNISKNFYSQSFRSEKISDIMKLAKFQNMLIKYLGDR